MSSVDSSVVVDGVAVEVAAPARRGCRVVVASLPIGPLKAITPHARANEASAPGDDAPAQVGGAAPPGGKALAGEGRAGGVEWAWHEAGPGLR